MKPEFEDYLKAIGMTKILIERIRTIIEFYLGIYPEEIQSIFVTDLINGDGQREYVSLWLFSEKYLMEAKSFTTEDNFDMTPVNNRIKYWSIEKQDYNFKSATDQSRLYVRFQTDVDISGDLKASKENCEFLKTIFIHHILPNLKE